MAEDVFSRIAHIGPYYKNLLDFEKELADICTLILIIIESAGSIAELGVFSALSNISKKTAVLIDSRLYSQRSFIKEGPVKHISQRNGEGWVLGFPLLDGEGKFDNCPVGVSMEDILCDIDGLLKSQRTRVKSKKLSLEDSSHIMYLIVDLIEVGQLLQLTEIIETLQCWSDDVSDEASESDEALQCREDDDSSKTNKLDKNLVKFYLELLRELSFVDVVRYSGASYYYRIPGPYNDPLVKWVFKSGSLIRDTIRWHDEFINYYEQTDRKRYSALKLCRENSGE